MIELSKELTERFEEAGKDAAWVERLRAATTWEEYEKLLGEKNIESPTELKDAFTESRSRKAGELADDELEKVSGGWFNLLPCNKAYHELWCELFLCPHFCKYRRGTSVILPSCDLGYYDHYDDLMKTIKKP